MLFFNARIYDNKYLEKSAIAVKQKAKPRIALLREKAGLTQLELSRLVGVTESTIQNWESGRTGTDHIERIVRFCKALNCRVEDLIEYMSESPETPGTPPSSLSQIHNLLGTENPAPNLSPNAEVAPTQHATSS
ncbi:putative XRE family protein [Tolypothrix sp. PCC 7601]|nr:putative XRE family protein [Tolypothrix sp. PCC 7601]